jgi:hypothetical protein
MKYKMKKKVYYIKKGANGIYKKGDDGEPTHLRYIIHNPDPKKKKKSWGIALTLQ